MHLDHRLGSLGEGKDADFVVLMRACRSASIRKVRETWIDGVKVFDASIETDRAYRMAASCCRALDELPKTPRVRPPSPLAASRNIH